MSPDISFVSAGQKIRWRGNLSTLTAQERAQVVRRFGAVLEVDLEALRRVKGVNTKFCKNEEKSVRTVSGKVVRDIVSTQQVHQSARQAHCNRESLTHKRLSKCRIIACAVETVINPTKDGIGLRTIVILQSLQSYCDVHANLLQKE